MGKSHACLSLPGSTFIGQNTNILIKPINSVQSFGGDSSAGIAITNQ